MRRRLLGPLPGSGLSRGSVCAQLYGVRVLHSFQDLFSRFSSLDELSYFELLTHSENGTFRKWPKHGPPAAFINKIYWDRRHMTTKPQTLPV